MSLQDYHKKRDFQATPEPKGQEISGVGHTYVIQKHEAKRLHFDFRLEVDGVLKSWAVPKGPSLNPKEKRLAVETEDHPVDYADFEGVIPKPHYGAGTVMLWDAGEWEADGDANKGLKSGKLSFYIHGKRLKGRWTLVKMKGGKTTGKEWLLVKDADEFADTAVDVAEEYTQSVSSSRNMTLIKESGKQNLERERENEQSDVLTKHQGKLAEASKGKQEDIEETLEALQDDSPRKTKAHGKDSQFSDFKARLALLPGAKKGAFPDNLRPQLATLYKHVPEGRDWVHEIKYDGYRLLARQQSQLRLLTRNGKDWTRKFPDIVKNLEGLPESILDGELVYLSESGISNFEGLQNALSTGKTERLVFYVFDIPYLEGYDLTAVPLTERKKLVADFVGGLNQEQIRYSEHIEGDGDEVFDHACKHGLEGIVSKQVDSRYVSARTKSWRKTKCAQRQEFVIVGYTEPGGSRTDFGALLLGYYQQDRLKYAGKVGTGFNAKQLREIGQQLRKRVRQKSPLAEVVDEPGASWVKPDLVAEVEFTEWTAAKRLRHPAFLGLREDKPARQIMLEVAKDAPEDIPTPESVQEQKNAGQRPVSTKAQTGKTHTGKVAGVSISHPDKLLYEQAGISKRDLAEYYLSVADHMLPYVRHRPLTLVRCPQGHTRHCFFQKHLTDAFSTAVKPIEIEEKKGIVSYAYVEDVKGLVELVQMGTLEIHTWGSKVDQVEKPDVLVFDLDPGEGVAWEQTQQGARDVHECLSNLGLRCFLRTSGGKGLHVVVPINRRQDWDEAKAFSKAVAQKVTQKQPDQYLATASKAKRKGKIFIDYLRNGRGATSVCSYSTRGKPGAPIATPLDWDELNDLESSQAYTLGNIGERLRSLHGDPWEGFHKVKQSITLKMKQALEMRG